jgi:cation diffusion facilitator CzcD-associated flavoprotein CzcO
MDQQHVNELHSAAEFDAIVIGAGFAGIFAVFRFRQAGLAVRGFEAGGGVGGTWYWNRYPGARCDSESTFYSYSFLPEFEQEWPLDERYPGQPVILNYLEQVAAHLDVLKDFTFNARIEEVTFDEDEARWLIRTADGRQARAKYVVTAVGCLSAANMPEFPGAGQFQGLSLHTSRWPHEPVQLAGKRVGVIGTGASGIQAIPVIAEQAAHLTVFQRTPQFTIPAGNGPLDPEVARMWKANYREWRRRGTISAGGAPYPAADTKAREVTPEERQAMFERCWSQGGPVILFGAFGDLLTDEWANQTAADFVRSKIDEIVQDPAVAVMLKPRTYPFATKRLPLDTNYFATYNRPNVTLVDLRRSPIEEITASGVRTTEGEHDLDILVYATGFDALTGPLLALNITGRDGLPLAERWADGPQTYLGLAVPGFPNLFTITGPGSPSVLTNMPSAIEQHVEWIAECIEHLEAAQIDLAEATDDAAAEWTQHVQDVAAMTLYPRAASWYMGANVPGKPRLFLPYVGGLHAYRNSCARVAADGYEGFRLTSRQLAGRQSQHQGEAGTQ